MDRPRPFTKPNKLVVWKKRCMRVVIFLFTLFALNYIFAPYKYIDEATNGSKITIEYQYEDQSLMFLNTSKYTDSTPSYYIKGKKLDRIIHLSPQEIDIDRITDKDYFYAITATEPNEKIYFSKKKDLQYFYKKIKGTFIPDTSGT